MLKCILIAHNNTYQNTSHFCLILQCLGLKIYFSSRKLKLRIFTKKNCAQRKRGINFQMLECKNKISFGIGMQKGLQKHPVHIFTSHIGHIKLAYCPADIHKSNSLKTVVRRSVRRSVRPLGPNGLSPPQDPERSPPQGS